MREEGAGRVKSEAVAVTTTTIAIATTSQMMKLDNSWRWWCCKRRQGTFIAMKHRMVMEAAATAETQNNTNAT
jgi:hypothetical protein